MATSVSPQTVWSQLFRELLMERVNLTTTTVETLQWGVDSMVRILQTVPSQVLYKNLVYLNRYSSIGRFAQVYTEKILQCLSNRDLPTLEKLLRNPTTPEYDDNSYLDSTQVQTLVTQMSMDITTLDQAMRKVLGSSSIPRVLLNSEAYRKCQEEVCLQETASGTGVVDCLQRSSYEVTQKDATVCFSMRELMVLLLQRQPNPHTGLPFPESLRAEVLQKHPIVTAVVIRYLDYREKHPLHITAESV